MDSPSRVLMLSTIFMVLLFHSNAANDPSKLVQKFCKETNNTAECLSALKPDPRTTSVSKLRDLAKIVLELAVANTTASQTDIKNIETNDTTPEFKDAINSCIDSYGYAIGSFSVAIRELDEDIMSANYDAKVAGDGATQCENIMALNKVEIPSSISTSNSYLKLYSWLGFLITEKLDS